MKLKEPCERCGTKKFKRKSDGTLVCKYGHMRLGWQVETQDEGMVYMGTKRKVHTQVERSRESRERFKGVDRASVNLQICQTGLNIAVEYCARELHFPEQTQQIALYLWDLYVSTSDSTMDFDIFNMDKEVEPPVTTQLAIPKTVEEELDVDLNISDDEQDAVEDDEEREDEDEVHEWPVIRYSDIMVFMFLTFKLAAIPVLLSDIRRWCKCQQIPYSKALLKIPKSVLRRVDKLFIYTTQHMPSVLHLYERARLYRKCFDKICGVSFPDVNVPALVHRLYPHLCLPDVFLGHALVLVDKMQEFMQSGECARFDAYDGVQAVVCLIVLVKFLYILDDKPQGTRNSSALPSAPPKKHAMVALRAELERLRTLRQKSDLSQIDACHTARLTFLRDFTEALKGAGYAREDIVLLGKKNTEPSKTKESQDLYLLHDKHPGTRTPVDKSLAEQQLRLSNTVYRLATVQALGGQLLNLSKMPKEYQTVIELAACLIDIDIAKLHRSLARFERYIKDDLLH